MPPNDPIKILVVDDLPDKRLVYQSILDEPGQEVIMASSGAEALRQVLRHDFAVILLDVNMPGMDGFETAGLIRTRKRCAHTPIIFVTADADDIHALRGYGYGAVDYICSPVAPEVLRTKVRVFVQLFRLNQQVREQAARRVALAEREQAHLTDLLERAADFVVRVDTNLNILSVNRAGRLMLGYGEQEEFPRRFSDHKPAWADQIIRDKALPTARSEGAWFGDSALRTRAGVELPVSQVVLAHYTTEGDVEHFSIVARDISERRRVEAELARYRAHLEDLVRERTAELEASHEKLRLADRLASIGTLVAGLGHDMGNLLLPVRMRIEALEHMELPDAAVRDIRAIADACEYLKRLSQGLRLFALNPESPHASADRTVLSTWWDDVAPFMRNALHRGIAFEFNVPTKLPPLAIPPHVLTQAVYNLVQNASDAMKARGTGNVTITAGADNDGRVVSITVADDGPGMTDEVLRRCMEPFFTTKTRGISTGLGLALVRGAVYGAGGSIDIHSRQGEGTTIRLNIPLAGAPGKASEETGPLTSAAAPGFVHLRDPRLRGYVSAVLRSLNVTVAAEPWSRGPTEAPLIVTDDPGNRAWELKEFLAADQARRAVVFGAAQNARSSDQVVYLEANPPAARIRAVLADAVRAQRAKMQESPLATSPPTPVPSGPIKVLCVDDNRLVAEALERRLTLENQLKWVGWVEDSANAPAVVRETRPDVVMLDIDMPGRDSFELVRELAETAPDVKVVMFSGHVRVDYVDRAIDAGAWGYLSKNQSMDEILESIQRVAAGEFVLTPEVGPEYRSG